MKPYTLYTLFIVGVLCLVSATSYDFDEVDPIEEMNKRLDDKLEELQEKKMRGEDVEEDYETFFGNLFDLPEHDQEV